MITDFEESCFPRIAEAIAYAEANPQSDLNELDWETIAGNLCEHLAVWHSQGLINLSGLTIKQTYDSLTQYYGKLPYSYANFKQYYRPKK